MLTNIFFLSMRTQDTQKLSNRNVFSLVFIRIYQIQMVFNKFKCISINYFTTFPQRANNDKFDKRDLHNICRLILYSTHPLKTMRLLYKQKKRRIDKISIVCLFQLD